MSFGPPYSVVIAAQADAQIRTASAWWRKNRPAAPHMLRDEVGAALLLLGERPEIGRRTRSKQLGTMRVLVLRRTAYRVYYQVLPPLREVRVVHFRHGRRRPLQNP